MIDYIYDIETYPNVFLLGAIEPSTGQVWKFEISERRLDIHDLLQWVDMLKRTNARMVGFNNIHFDYPVLHRFLTESHVKATAATYDLYEKAQTIIESNDRFVHTVWERDQLVPQVDLFKIHHFDNIARATSLKLLEFNMRRDRIEELPFEPGTYLTPHQIDMLIDYNLSSDIPATVEFYRESLDAIRFREELSQQYGRNFINYNDTKIGKEIFIMRLEERQPGSCYEWVDDQRQPRQTHRGLIPLNTVIFPYIQFEHPEFQRIHQWFLQQSVYDTNGVFKDINCNVGGLKFDFGTGGIHASMNNAIVVADLDDAILDIDVKSYYPNLAIANRLHPEHLGEAFVDIYRELYVQRSQYPKNDPINKALKLALNGVYGDSGNGYSPFFDLKYLLSITINGQLLICMLAEQLAKVPTVKLIQVNTDGLTIKVRRDQAQRVQAVCDWWQGGTRLELEQAEYTRMFIRDVNNYIAEYTDGKLKRKGAYEHAHPRDRNPIGWHQNLGGMVIPKAAEAYLTHGIPIDWYIRHHDDIMDFMLRAKVKRTDRLELSGVPVQRVSRYLVTRDGGSLVKVSPPPTGYKVGQWKRANSITERMYRDVLVELRNSGGTGDELDSTGLPWDERINTKNRSKYEERNTSIEAGWLVTLFNRIDGPIDREQINYDYYIQAARRLVEQLEYVR